MASEAETTPAQSEESLTDIWERIPPEERLELLATAQARGIEAALLLLLMAFSASLGLHTPWIFFGSLLFTPFAFQIMSRKSWRVLKPHPMLEYLTSRSTARVYASLNGARDLDPSLMFRAELQPEFTDDAIEDMPSDALEKPAPKPVWVSLFPDTIVIASESPSGSRLELGHSLFKNFSISAEGFDEESDSSPQRRVKIEVESHPGTISRWYLSGKHTASLLACERRARAFIARHEREIEIREQQRLERERQAQARLEQQRARSPQLAYNAAL